MRASFVADSFFCHMQQGLCTVAEVETHHGKNNSFTICQSTDAQRSVGNGFDGAEVSCSADQP